MNNSHEASYYDTYGQQLDEQESETSVLPQPEPYDYSPPEPPIKRIVAGVALAAIVGGGFWAWHDRNNMADELADAQAQLAGSSAQQAPGESDESQNDESEEGSGDEEDNDESNETNDESDKPEDSDSNGASAAGGQDKPIKLLSDKTVNGQLPSTAWVSGFSGVATTEDSDKAKIDDIATWRNKQVGVVGTWCDTQECHPDPSSILDKIEGFNGPVDIAIGILYKDAGETYEKAASGEYAKRWEGIFNVIAEKRPTQTTHARVAHEFNLDSSDWALQKGDEENFKKSFCMMSDIVDKVNAEKGTDIQLAFSPNATTVGDNMANPLDAWPIHEKTNKPCANVLAFDSYDWDTPPDAKDEHGPKGDEAWAQAAKKLGVPFALSEWGNKNSPDAVDDPGHMELMYNFLDKHKPKNPSKPGPGELAYEIHFNIDREGSYLDKIFPKNGHLPKSSDKYQQLWQAAPARQ